jgi:hypothetical protein
MAWQGFASLNTLDCEYSENSSLLDGSHEIAVFTDLPIPRMHPRVAAHTGPPVTGRTTPLTKLESAFEARNTKAGATSSGCAGRPMSECPTE